MLQEIQDCVDDIPNKIKKKWKTKIENKTFEPADLFNYFKLSSPYFLTIAPKDNASEIGERVTH
jgi:hypothetical protein